MKFFSIALGRCAKFCCFPIAVAFAALLAGCGGGGGGGTQGVPSNGSSGSGASSSGNSNPITYTVGGTISGLTAGTYVTLVDNGADRLTLSSNGSFTFSSPVNQGGTYSILVSKQPIGETCSPSGGTGSGSGVSANISSIRIVCSVDTYTIGGTVNGLAGGTQVTLLNNGADILTVQANGNFTFSGSVAYAGSYSIGVAENSVDQLCQVSGGSGTAVAANVNSVNVACTSLLPTESTLYSFQSQPDANNPVGGLLLATNGNLYSISEFGGTYGAGTALEVTPAGVETILHNFGLVGDGSSPDGALVQAINGTLYGTTYLGGNLDKGAVVSITPSNVESVLYSFGAAGDGASPAAALIRASDGNLYGTTYAGGSSGFGTVFKITTPGAETVLYSFGSGFDAQNPTAALVQASDGNFYGTTRTGGTHGAGTVFRITPAGVETVLYSFDNGPNGGAPTGALVEGNDGNLYGTAISGGNNSGGTIFKISLAGEFTLLHAFLGGADGSSPDASLFQSSDGNFYGTTFAGGTSGMGTVFVVTPSGSATVVYAFGSGADGAQPNGGVVQAVDGTFYGITYAGGANGFGGIFQITIH